MIRLKKRRPFRSAAGTAAAMCAKGGILPEGPAMSCGTVGATGGIRPSASFSMELFDPRRERSLRHAYEIDFLPEVA